MYSSPVNHSWGGAYCVTSTIFTIEIFIIYSTKIIAAIRLVVKFLGLQFQPKYRKSLSTLKKTE